MRIVRATAPDAEGMAQMLEGLLMAVPSGVGNRSAYFGAASIRNTVIANLYDSVTGECYGKFNITVEEA